jgi:ethanolamine ammonia-lyase small subunit
MATDNGTDGLKRKNGVGKQAACPLEGTAKTAKRNQLIEADKAPKVCDTEGSQLVEQLPLVDPLALVQQDPHSQLNAFTQARISLGRVGTSLPTAQIQALGLAHAVAKDAVYLALDTEKLSLQLNDLGLETITVSSQVSDRAQYLLRPDLGRRLSKESTLRLKEEQVSVNTLQLVLADGLSALATSRHGFDLIKAIVAQLPESWTVGKIVIATQARVALADEIAALLDASMVAILIGERPGLSTPDSLGIYFTYAPKLGCTDAQRNCISNIHGQGLSYQNAATKLLWLAQEARRIQASGIKLKDESYTTSVHLK